MTAALNSAFATFLDAAAPYLDDIVIVGGWASRLHRLSPLASLPGFAPLLTDDLDAALRLRAPTRERRLDHLLLERGFEERLSGAMKPPVTHYVLPGTPGFEVEFLTDQPGGYARRDGSPDLTASIAGVTAQKLHYVRLLLVDPLTVEVGGADGFPIDGAPLRVRVPNPVSYVVQKLLARKHRGAKRVKDLLYIHDTIQVFGEDEEGFARGWAGVIAEMQRPWIERCRTSAKQLADESHPDVIDCARAARSAGREASPTDIALALRVGLAFLQVDP